ncbi:MAG TPA: lysophospholipid acyltransferase family protein [Candidatus Dormibacteraeota bacterium]|nr:lysophospholipid acyltransferase family protein [Candidatus Dormibacteraeota bacterium]
MKYAFLRGLMRFMVDVYLVGLFKLSGLENVPRDGPLIICPNHIGTIDPPLVPAFIPRADTWNMAKSEYFRNRMVNWLFRSYQAFPVVRHTADRVALRRAFEILKAGHALVIYPEGTRIEAGVLAEPEPGAGFIAQRCGCPVLPVAVTGTAECLPKGAKWPRRVPVTMTVGAPFVVLQRRSTDDSRVSHEEAADAIMLRIAELLPPDKRGKFTDVEGLRSRLAGVTRPA